MSVLGNAFAVAWLAVCEAVAAAAAAASCVWRGRTVWVALVFSGCLLYLAERLVAAGQSVRLDLVALVLFGPGMTWIEGLGHRRRYQSLADEHAALKEQHDALQERHETLSKQIAAIMGRGDGELAEISAELPAAGKETPKP